MNRDRGESGHDKQTTNITQGWCEVSNEWHDDNEIDKNCERETEGMWVE